MSELGSLLVNLRSYRPREGRDSLENFVTEVFRWLLDSAPAFAEHFLQRVNSEMPEGESFELPKDRATWHSQFSLGTKRPDMVAQWANTLLVFEHKVWSSSLSSQLNIYKSLAGEHYPGLQSIVVLIAPHRAEFKAAADICLCWSDVYRCIDLFLQYENNTDLTEAYLRDFLALLDHEGIGIPAPVSQAAIRYYPEASRLPRQLQRLYSQLAHENWVNELTGYRLGKNGSRWGRVGLNWSRVDAPNSWSPGLALCTLIDGADHCVQHRFDSEPLKLQVLVSFNKVFRGAYQSLPQYGDLKQALQELATTHGWDFYDHLDDASAKSHNTCHPLYLEVPLMNTLRGAKTLEEQVACVKQKALPVITGILALDQLEPLKKACDELYSEPDSENVEAEGGL